MRGLQVGGLAVGLAACAGDINPNEPGDPFVWLMQFFDADADAVAAHVEQIDAYVLRFDPASEAFYRSFTPGVLTPDARDAVPHATPTSDLFGVALARKSAFRVGAHQRLATAADRACLEPSTFLAAARTVEEGANCFADAACDEARASDAVRLAWGEAALDLVVQTAFREIELIDGRRAIVERFSLPAPAIAAREGDAMVERYGLHLWIPDLEDEDQAWQVGSLWTQGFFLDPNPLVESPLGDRLIDELEERFKRQDLSIGGTPVCGTALTP
jgi:hypothetical protein